MRGLAVLAAAPPAAIRRPDAGYGPLVPQAAENTGETLLALPEGFRYTAFGRTGDLMTDGRPTPSAHDGMAAFQVGDELRLVRNHEVRRPGPALAADGPSYDDQARGGTSTLVIDPETRTPARSFVSLSGTAVNCAGGPTPWGSWVTCEETLDGVADGFRREHGYCFEVPAAAHGPVEPAPLREMGRFVHEAIAVDPDTGVVYLTEDQSRSGFYRFRPRRRDQLRAGGRLQMLAIRGRRGYDTRIGQTPFQELPVSWVDITDPDPGPMSPSVREQGLGLGGATFARLEGAWYGAGRIYFDATSGGDLKLGQIWEYAPDDEGGSLRLIFESRDPAVLNMPDNLCMSPRGTGLTVCEDGPSVQHIRGLTLDGQIFDFARNAVPAFEKFEFAGATFSPDGETLFVNIQTPGITFAIWGDWASGPL
jgi:secreted PhoX family phosphatase